MENGNESQHLQSSPTNNLPQLRRFMCTPSNWCEQKRSDCLDDGNCKSGNNNSNIDEDNNDSRNASGSKEKQQQRREKKPISFHIVPDVLEVLAHKPLLLYTFFRDEIDHSQLLMDCNISFTFSVQNQQHRRRRQRQRRSVRLPKKLRLQSPASAYLHDDDSSPSQFSKHPNREGTKPGEA